MTNSLLKLLITGGTGQIASAIQHHHQAKTFELIPRASHELDITVQNSIDANIKQFNPDVIINTAAYTAVDKAEQEYERAFHINEYGAKQLALACAKHNI